MFDVFLLLCFVCCYAADQNTTRSMMLITPTSTPVNSLPVDSKIMFSVDGRCIYDGGTTTLNDGKYFIISKCASPGSPSFSRQEFIYNTNTLQIMNTRLDIGWCIDSGGRDKKLFTYQLCDPLKPSQMFYYDSYSQQLLSPYLATSTTTSIYLPFNPYSMPADQIRCVDTNSGLVQLKPCSPYQKFKIINNGIAPTGAPKLFANNVVPTGTPSKTKPFQAPSPSLLPSVAFNPFIPFVIKSNYFSGYCLHSPSVVRVTTNIQLQPCQYPSIANQKFIMDKKQIKLANKLSLCLDASNSVVSLMNCDSDNSNQIFNYDALKKFMTVNNLCFDCQGGINSPLTFTPWFNGQSQQWTLENTK